MFWQHVVPFGTQWTYWSEAEAVGTGWQSADFDDGAWATGTAPLGYGNGNEVTVVDYGEDPANKPITTYFRTTFEIDNPQDFEALRFYLVGDDGAVVYLNGQEVYRSNMPDGEIDSQTVASEGVKSADESVIHEALLSPEFLQAGENTLAVEVHLIGPASADMRMDANLVAKPYGAETYTEVTWEPQ